MPLSELVSTAFVVPQGCSYIDEIYCNNEMKMLKTLTHDSHYCTFLGHLGWCHTDRNDPICVAL